MDVEGYVPRSGLPQAVQKPMGSLQHEWQQLQGWRMVKNRPQGEQGLQQPPSASVI